MFRKKEQKKERVLVENNMDIEEIKNKLENRSIERRISFIEEYDFESDMKNRNYFISFIKNAEKSKNEWYTIKLVELAVRLEVIDINLLKNYLSYLTTESGIYLKLAILDYIDNMYYYENIDYSSVKVLLNKKYDRLIVKNQALLTMIILEPQNINNYFFELKKNLIKTSDYRSHIRIYNIIVDYDFYNHFNSILSIEELIGITESKEFSSSRSVQEALNRVKIYAGVNKMNIV